MMLSEGRATAGRNRRNGGTGGVHDVWGRRRGIRVGAFQKAPPALSRGIAWCGRRSGAGGVGDGGQEGSCLRVEPTTRDGPTGGRHQRARKIFIKSILS